MHVVCYRLLINCRDNERNVLTFQYKYIRVNQFYYLNSLIYIFNK